jgi:AraC family transcriptional regulator
MTIEPGPPDLRAGSLFGDSHRTISTASFRFADLDANVPEREVPKHTHDLPHFILVTHGVYLTEARNCKGPCSEGTLIFNPAGTTHRDCFLGKSGRFVSISLQDGIEGLLGRSSGDSVVLAGNGIRLLDDPLIAGRISRELRRGLPVGQVVLESLGLELIGHLGELEERAELRSVPDWLLRLREMMQDCSVQDLGMAELARLAGVHPVYLARAHRRHFGCTPGDYLRRCRLLRVQDLLSETTQPLVDIALQCGFSDQSQMTRLFSKHFGMPPARYRRLRRQ